MPAFCTCGTELAPDSLFCHKCGKPQRDIPDYQPETPVVEPVPAAPPPETKSAANLDFRNPVAVRTAFTVALIATLLSPLMGILGVPLWAVAGYFAVLLYHRRTGFPLNVKAGMRMGWITGVLLFAFTTVVITINWLPTAARGGFGALFKQQIKNPNDPSAQELMKFLDTAPGMVTVLLTTLTALFVIITLLSMAGGALGAKWSSRSRS